MGGNARGLPISLASQSPVSGACVFSLSVYEREHLQGFCPIPVEVLALPSALLQYRKLYSFSCSAFSLVPADKHCEWKTAKNCMQGGTKAFWKLAFAKIETATLTLTLALSFSQHHMVAQKTKCVLCIEQLSAWL